MENLQIPDGVFSVTTNQALSILGISRSTLGDYKECLNCEKPDGWDYIPGQRGFTVSQLRIVWLLKCLVGTLGRPSAQEQLHAAIKENQANG